MKRLSLLNKQNLDRVLFWCYELYYSTYENDIFPLLFKIYFDFYALKNPKFYDYITKNYDKWKKLYDNGFATIMFNVLDLTEELRELNEKLMPIRGSHTLANIYFSKGTETRRPSFDAHTHDYNVIVKPIYGKVHWKINGEDFIADPKENPNSVIVIPAYTEHQVVSSKEPKLSLTINLTA